MAPGMGQAVVAVLVTAAIGLLLPTFLLRGLWAFIVLGYLVPQLSVAFSQPQDLKAKYGATWALVTGGSSGIGKSIAAKLATQGINVVLAAYPDKTLDDTYAQFAELFPKVQFRKVKVDLGTRGYLEDIKRETDGLDITIVFNNAGYIVTGFFDKTPLDKVLANMECNAVASVAISHHFVTQMIRKKQKGCVVFTSSAAHNMPGPFSVVYAATKAFMSTFAGSLGIEVKSKGIDVCVVHPSPVASNFYDKAHKISAMEFFKSMAVSPDALPDEIFKSIGRCAWRDIGLIAIIFTFVRKIVDYNLMLMGIAVCAPYLPDFKKYA